MSSTKRAVLTILMFTAITATAAQAGKAAFVGVTLPQKAWSDVADNGVHAGFEMTAPVMPLLLSLGGQVMISRNATNFGTADESASWYTGEVLGIARVTIPITGVYAKIGLGFNRYSVSGEGVDYNSETHLAGAAGIGWKVMLVDLNVMYHVVKWDAAAPNPGSLDEVDDNYSYFTASAGLSF